MTTPNVAPVRWGILGVASIAVRKAIPGMHASPVAQPVAIASRDAAKARAVAGELGIPRAYGSYDALLDDAEVEAVYIPLPNHLHVPWSIRAARAGKHVLCEKPIAMSAAEARELMAVRDETGVQIGEAFVVRTHPQWIETHRLVHAGRIGALRLVTGHFSYFRRDPSDIRSHPEWGGGALMDIGCYPIFLARWMFGEEPTEVVASMERDPELGVDRLTSAILRFPSGQATFTCAGQLVRYQRMHLLGETGRIEVEVPFNPVADRRCRLWVDDGSLPGGDSAEVIEFPAVDQFEVPISRFSAAVRGVGSVPVPLENSVGNMAVIDALVRSASSGAWEPVRK